MPADSGHGVGFFDKEIAGPVVEVGSEDAFDEIEDFRMLTDVVQVGAGLVPFADILGGFAVFEEREEGGQLGVDLIHLLHGENGGETEEVAIFVIEGFLLLSELMGGFRHKSVGLRFRWSG